MRTLKHNWHAKEKHDNGFICRVCGKEFDTGQQLAGHIGGTGHKMSYQDYLESEEWEMLKKLYVEENGFDCSFCGGTADEFHHVRYPRTYAEDSIRNIVPVCCRCHALQHQKRGVVNGEA